MDFNAERQNSPLRSNALVLTGFCRSPLKVLIAVLDTTIQYNTIICNAHKVEYTLSQKAGPLLHFQITPTILVQYQQILVQRIVN